VALASDELITGSGVDDDEAAVSEEHPGSSWKGRAVEWLVAAQCILASRGRLNVSTAMVDDEGVNLKGTPNTLAVQVKSRFASSKLFREKGAFRAMIRRKVFRPRSDLCLLFILFDDIATFAVDTAWLVPSVDFVQLTQGQKQDRPRLVFAARPKGTKGMWCPYRCSQQELAQRVIEAIEAAHSER
jgi:hypothetical protein